MNNAPSEQPSIHESIRQVFELAWSNGSPLPIESVLPNVDEPSSLPTLLQLIHIELQHAWPRSQQDGASSPAKLEEYLERFRLLRTPECLAELLQWELVARRQLGIQPAIDDYRGRFSLLINDAELAELVTPAAEDTDRGLQAGETRPQLPPPASDTSGQDMQTIMPEEEESMIILGSEYVVEDTTPDREMATIAPEPQYPSGSSGSQGGTVSSETAGIEPIVIGGQTLPGYDILGELGRGGMGVVYKAHERKLKRIVAVKMILSGIHASDEDMNRFQIEAEAVAQLQHPGIVQIYDVGNHGDKPYITLEYVDGGNLDDLTGGDPLAADHAAELVIKMCDAIQAAHDQQIIHRDLKPANILITVEGDPKITDFGLAKRLDDDSQQTKSGSVMGTPSYMAPEQAGSKKGSIGPATDVYALGAILYRLLTGRPPFQAETPVDTLMQVVSDDPFPPRRLNPKVPLDVETICLKALQKDSARRYATAAELAEDLRHYVNDEPILARPVSTWERTRKWARRRPALASMIAVSCCALLFILIWGSLKNAALRTALGDAETQRGLAETQTEAATASKEKAENSLVASEASRRRVKQVLADMLQQRNTVDAIPWLANELRYKNDSSASDSSMSRRSWEILFQHTPKPTWHLPIPATTVRGVELIPDSNVVAACGTSSHVYFWNIETGESARDPINVQSPPSMITISPSGKHLLVVRNYPYSKAAAKLAAEEGGPFNNLATPSKGVVRIWDLTSRDPLPENIEHAGLISFAAYSPDGSMILTASLDTTARLWDATSGQQIGESLEHIDPVTAATFSPDGSQIATGTSAGGIHLWESETHRRVGSEMSHSSIVKDLQFSPDGTILASASFDDTARLWDASTGSPLGKPLLHEGDVLGIIFNHAGDQLATGSRDWRVRVWDTTTGELVFAPLQHKGIPSEGVFSPDDSLLATSSRDRTVRIWDTTTGMPVGQPLWHHGPVMTCQFHPDGRRILTGTGGTLGGISSGGAVRIWDLASNQINPVSTETSPAIAKAHMTPDGEHLVTYTASGIVRRRLSDGGMVDEFEIPNLSGHLTHIEWNPERTIVVAASDNQLFGWNFSGERPRPIRLNDRLAFTTSTLKENDHRIGRLQFSGKESNLLVSSVDGWVDLWDLRSEKITFSHHRTFPGDFGWVEMTGDQKFFYLFHNEFPFIQLIRKTRNNSGFTGSKPLLDQNMQLGQPTDLQLVGPKEHLVIALTHVKKGHYCLAIDPNEGNGARILTREMAHNEAIHFFRANHDGTRLLTASQDNTARYWDLVSGEPITPPLQHEGDVRHACFSRSGDLLATASDTRSGGAARVWDARTGIPLTPPLEHEDATVVFVDFSPDSSHLVSVDRTGVTKIWRLHGRRSLETDKDVLAAAKLATNSMIDDSGALVPVSAAELETLLAASQNDVDQQAAPTSDQRFAWYRSRVMRCQELELWPDMIRHAQQMGSLLPESPEPHVHIGFARAAMGDLGEASLELLTATEKGATNSGVWQAAALALLGSEDNTRFVELCQQMGERFSLKDASRRTSWILCLSPLTAEVLQSQVDAEEFSLLLEEKVEARDDPETVFPPLPAEEASDDPEGDKTPSPSGEAGDDPEDDKTPAPSGEAGDDPEDIKPPSPAEEASDDPEDDKPALSLVEALHHAAVLYRLGHDQQASRILTATLGEKEKYEEKPRSLIDYRPQKDLEAYCWAILAMSKARQGDSAALTFFAIWLHDFQELTSWKELSWQRQVALNTLLKEAESLLTMEPVETN